MLISLLFADDQVITASDAYDIEYMMRKLVEAYEKAGPKVNFDKTKYMVVGEDANDLDMGGMIVHNCEEYNYLGGVIFKEGDSKKEILARIVQAKQAIQKLNLLLWSKDIQRQIKIRIYDTIVQSILLYASEIWEIAKRDEQRLNAVQMDFLRSAGISRTQCIPKGEIRSIMDIDKAVMEKI